MTVTKRHSWEQLGYSDHGQIWWCEGCGCVKRVTFGAGTVPTVTYRFVGSSKWRKGAGVCGQPEPSGARAWKRKATLDEDYRRALERDRDQVTTSG